jgi:serine phosphatase RsbU (regulator of sigma subunit)
VSLEGVVLASSAPTLYNSSPRAYRFRLEQSLYRISESGGSQEAQEREILGAPILVHNDLIGYVVGHHERDDTSEALYATNLQLVATFIGDKAYTEYELRNLTEELLEKYSEITLIYDISEHLSAVFDRKTACEVIIKQIVDVVQVKKASIMLYDEEAHQLYVEAHHGFAISEDAVQLIRVDPNDLNKISARVFSTGRHELGDNGMDNVSMDIPRGKSFVCIPIVFNSMNQERKVMGVINMADKISADAFTADDLRLLTAIASQAAMALYNIQLVEDVKDAERVRREMEIAQQIQTRLLPGEPPVIPGLDLAGRCLPATQVGGDYYDFFLHSEHELGVVIADVSGHDVGSAFIMATARSALRSEVLARKSPARILQDTNYVLHDDLTRSEKFITMFYAEFDGSCQLLRYSNAAHNPPILLRNQQCRVLDTDGLFIGMWDSVQFEEKIIHLLSNDFVILYTDGVVEAKNDADEMFTVEGLTSVLTKIPGSYTAEELLETIYEEVEQFSGNAHRSDDITVMVLKVQ